MAKTNKQNKSEKSNSQQVAKEKKQSFELTKDKYPALVGFLVLLASYLWVWTDTDVRPIDPWYTAVALVDSANKSQDPEIKSKLNEEGGEKLRKIIDKYGHLRVVMFYGYHKIVKGELDSAIFYLKKSIDEGKGGTINNHEFQAAQMMRYPVLTFCQQYLNEQKYDSLVYMARMGVEYLPNDAQTNYVMGLAMNTKVELDSALFYFARAASIDKSHQDAFRNYSLTAQKLARWHFEQRDFAKSADYFLKALVLDTENAPLNYETGLAYYNAGNTAEANKYLSKAAQIEPSNLQYAQLANISKSKLGQ